MEEIDFAKAVVEFAAKGAEKVTAAGKGILGVLGQITNQAISVAKALSFGGSLGIGALIAGAGRGTIEMEGFGKAVDLAVRAVGDKFAPYVRMATLAVADFVEWFSKLDSQLIATAAKWAIVGTAIATAVAALPLVVEIVTALLSPLGLVVAAVAAAAIAFAAWGEDAAGGGAKVANAIMGDTKTWFDYVMDVVQKVGTAFTSMWNAVVNVTVNAINKMAEALGRWAKAVDEKFAIPAVMKGDPWAGAFRNIAQGLNNWKPLDPDKFLVDIPKLEANIGKVAADAKGLFAGVAAYWDNLKNRAGSGGFHVRMEGTGYETFGASLDRLQTGINKGAAVEYQKQAVQELQRLSGSM